LKDRHVGRVATPEMLARNRATPPDNVTAEARAYSTYRAAVRAAWELRRVPLMTRQQLATEAELYPQHVTDYLAEDDKPGRRDLPADAVARFEGVVGNTLVSQWLAAQSKLTVLEEVQATRAFA
jgi:hypothetical protein